jgi:hypothetical protein
LDDDKRQVIDDMLSVYDDLGITLNSSSHPNHKTMVRMAWSTVGIRSTSSVMDEDTEDNVNGDEDDDNNQPEQTTSGT